MVGFWDRALAQERLVTINRIKHMEKHGIGNTAMEEKARLKKIERKIQLRKDETA